MTHLLIISVNARFQISRDGKHGSLIVFEGRDNSISNGAFMKYPKLKVLFVINSDTNTKTYIASAIALT